MKNPNRKFPRTVAVAIPFLALAALAALTLQAAGPPFEGSAIVATADEIDAGDQVGFALYLVNSSATTLSNVFAWNPLPPGSSFVSASGGAFPVTGRPLSGAARIAPPPEGYAYDAETGGTIPLATGDEVIGVAWVGDIAPGDMVVPGLIVAASTPGGRDLVDTAYVYHDQLREEISGQTWIRPFHMFLIGVYKGYEPPAPGPTPAPTPTPTPTTFVTLTLSPAESGVVGTSAATREQALAASEGLWGWPNDGEFKVHAQHDTWVVSTTTGLDLPSDRALQALTPLSETQEFWSFDRQYFRFELPAGAIPLDLRLPVYLSVLQPVSGTVGIQVHAGTWTGPVEPVLDVWTGWEPEPLGQLTLTLPLSQSVPFTLTIPLDAAPATNTQRLVLRLSCEDTPCAPTWDEWFLRMFSGQGPSLRVRAPKEP